MEDKDEITALSFEEKLRQVQEMTARIENGTLPLEEAVKEFERGMKILGDLDTELSDMKRRISVLQDGKEAEIPDENI